jgi:hypothetical protein
MTLSAATLISKHKFDYNERSGFMIKSDDDERGQRDRGLPIGAFRYDDDEDYDEEWDEYDERYDDDDEPLGASMARLAAEIEAGHAEVPRGWKLDRPSPGVLVWTTPSGRRYASDLTGEYVPLPEPARH